MLIEIKTKYHENLNNPTYHYFTNFIQTNKENNIVVFTSKENIKAKELKNAVDITEDTKQIYPESEDEIVNLNNPLILTITNNLSIVDYYCAMIAIHNIFGKLLTMKNQPDVQMLRVKNYDFNNLKKLVSVEELTNVNYEYIKKLRFIDNYFDNIDITLHEFVLPIDVIKNFIDLIPEKFFDNDMDLSLINEFYQFISDELNIQDILPGEKLLVYSLTRCLPYEFNEGTIVRHEPLDEYVIEIGDKFECNIYSSFDTFFFTTNSREVFYILDNATILMDGNVEQKEMVYTLKSLINRGIYGIDYKNVILNENLYNQLLNIEGEQGKVFKYYNDKIH